MQQIVAQLLFNGLEEVEVAEMSPWLDLRVSPKDVKFAELRRKHTVAQNVPVDALCFLRKPHIYLGRDGRMSYI